jgi:hypothetical protein
LAAPGRSRCREHAEGGCRRKEGRAITFLSMEVTLIVLFLVAGIFIPFAQAASEGN